ncbi:hypothetical protein PCS_02630 [Desulfocurvibacter africanus PCS]|uniref:Uncharacterized protein n=1 Tax=Desulfocurvibacter africanus PCS TaxID=1262666 RepID=M5Q1J9_DESAF|nr:hypothetical protein [Desulfocurvibacter africanus]EMG36618.1 hypothetical protein PCS_02630 [Desulfocurvibacter africanus PCS]
MGKGIIRENKGGGLYGVEIQYEKTAVQAALDALNAQIIDYDAIRLPFLLKALDEARAAYDAQLSKVQAAIMAGEDGAALSTLLDDLAKLEAKWITARREYDLARLDRESLAGRRSVYEEALAAFPVVNAWCATYTSDLPAGREVATIELNGESSQVLVAPQGATWTPAEGQLAQTKPMSPAQAFYNAAMLPGWQRWRPTYRVGIITSIDRDAGTCSLELVPAASSAQGLAINPPEAALSVVPFSYLSCGDKAFLPGDRVLVRFENQTWSSPRIIGFESNPKPCALVIKCFQELEDEWIDLTPSVTVNVYDADLSEVTIARWHNGHHDEDKIEYVTWRPYMSVPVHQYVVSTDGWYHVLAMQGGVTGGQEPDWADPSWQIPYGPDKSDGSVNYVFLGRFQYDQAQRELKIIIPEMHLDSDSFKFSVSDAGDPYQQFDWGSGRGGAQTEVYAARQVKHTFDAGNYLGIDGLAYVIEVPMGWWKYGSSSTHPTPPIILQSGDSARAESYEKTTSLSGRVSCTFSARGTKVKVAAWSSLWMPPATPQQAALHIRFNSNLPITIDPDDGYSYVSVGRTFDGIDPGAGYDKSRCVMSEAEESAYLELFWPGPSAHAWPDWQPYPKYYYAGEIVRGEDGRLWYAISNAYSLRLADWSADISGWTIKVDQHGYYIDGSTSYPYTLFVGEGQWLAYEPYWSNPLEGFYVPLPWKPAQWPVTGAFFVEDWTPTVSGNRDEIDPELHEIVNDDGELYAGTGTAWKYLGPVSGGDRYPVTWTTVAIGPGTSNCKPTLQEWDGSISINGAFM